MSDSVTLRKTYGVSWMISAFVLFAIGILFFLAMFLPFEAAFFFFFLFLFIVPFFAWACIAAYEHFIEAGKYMEKEARKRKRSSSISEKNDDEDEEEEENEEEKEEERDISSLKDSAQLRKTYGSRRLILAFILVAGIIIADWFLFPITSACLLFIAPEVLLIDFITDLVSDACDYFMKAGMYLEKINRVKEC